MVPDDGDSCRSSSSPSTMASSSSPLRQQCRYRRHSINGVVVVATPSPALSSSSHRQQSRCHPSIVALSSSSLPTSLRHQCRRHCYSVNSVVVVVTPSPVSSSSLRQQSRHCCHSVTSVVIVVTPSAVLLSSSLRQYSVVAVVVTSLSSSLRHVHQCRHAFRV
mmetsp:Transcript_61743/g.145971  ORF Transcript_61743/g.145971 Transcript_61743/m.145971 type:complete len:163 (-) Transcript_61743:740-1228(-)